MGMKMAQRTVSKRHEKTEGYQKSSIFFLKNVRKDVPTSSRGMRPRIPKGVLTLGAQTPVYDSKLGTNLNTLFPKAMSCTHALDWNLGLCVHALCIGS